MQLIIIILIKERKGARVLKDDCDDSTSSYTMLCLSDQDRVVCEKLLKSIRSGWIDENDAIWGIQEAEEDT